MLAIPQDGTSPFDASGRAVISNLSAGAVSLAPPQPLARHRDSKLTGNLHAQLGLDVEVKVLANLTSVPELERSVRKVAPDSASARPRKTDLGPMPGSRR
jgi:hypothetical protein